LEIGDSVHISEVKLPDGVAPADQEEDFTVATIVAPSAMKSEDEEAAPAGEVPTVEGGDAGETDAAAADENE
jgi:large subunit ribosomal protein L25